MREVQEKTQERAVLVGVKLPHMDERQFQDSLAELTSLADTAGAKVIGRFIQVRQQPDAATLIGKGKTEELAGYCQEAEVDLVVFDRELSPAQARNLENKTGVKVIDRTQLILDIFARRAQTKEGKLQVELAQLKYLLPRLAGQGTQLSRLGGGIGTRGPGETKLETDRRRIRKRIADLGKELKEVQQHRALLRKSRRGEPLPLVSLVGYTNAGKSTLLRMLSGADITVEDKLFATLDPTTRRVQLPNHDHILLTDTVGFIQNLPHHLVAAFRATLEEVREADLLLHVADAAHPNCEGQIRAVESVLASLQCLDKPLIVVFNKTDMVKDREDIPYTTYPKVHISALKGWGMQQLLNLIVEVLQERYVNLKLSVPYKHLDIVSLLHQKGKVQKEEYRADGIYIEAEISRVWAERLKKRLL
ncbi:GTPase HflX [Desulforamulus hydrothermalis]|uniref:GTPase HflX n=1 Tax=Desulforamulus hydrothermalis TaxID=412895 RepID=UPI00091FFCB7|nr:GTPase HflX [Desulforamulus hydrothermalis]SHH48635.1 GTP-binding protein HflX [Desulforamulus hydrothermalis Lam5 = DSM 18033]